MKPNLDLTENRDFDPANFKSKKLVTVFRDADKKYRVPWNKNGVPLNNMERSHIWWNSSNPIFSTTTSWNGLSITSTSNHEFGRDNTLVNYTYTFQSPRGDETISIPFIYDNNGNMSSYINNGSISYVSYSLDTPYYYSTDFATDYYSLDTIPNIHHDNNFVVGRISKMKEYYQISRRIESRGHYINKYGAKKIPYYRIYNEDERYKVIIDCANVIRKYHKEFLHDYDRYQGYDSDIEYMRIGIYKREKERDIYTMQKYLKNMPIYKILLGKDHCRQLKNIDEQIYLRKVWGVFNNKDEEKRMYWPDFHEDYLREQMGRPIRNDWKRGIRGTAHLDDGLNDFS